MKNKIKNFLAIIGMIAISSVLIICGFRKRVIDIYDLQGVIAEE